jgi:peptidoglycan/xylan/chitin deacetylase (PgdA/CDA1 family)
MTSATALPVLMYHHVSSAPGLVTVSPATFRAHMQGIAQHGWRTVTCADLAAFLNGTPIPKKSVLITFDDGYLDNYVHAYPVLRELGLHAAIFLVTGWIGDGPVRNHASSGADIPECPDHRACKAAITGGESDRVMLRWSEIEKMAADDSCEFHSHTHTHTRWDKTISDRHERNEALASDLAHSRQAFVEHLGSASDHLCWPQGYFDEDYLEVAERSDYRYCYTTDKGTVTTSSDRRRIPRIVAKEASSNWLALRMKIFGNHQLGRLYVSWHRD